MSESTSDGVDVPNPPHLLYVAWGYPPARSAGMYRTLATANAFASEGWKVTVLTATRDAFETLTGTDTAAESRIDSRISVIRAPFDLERGQTDLADWSRLRARLPLWWSLFRSLKEHRFFPETFYGDWYSALVEAANKIHENRPVSLVIGSANPNVDFAPGDFLKRKHGVPYVMDYRDAWHLNIYTGKTEGMPWRRSARIERRLLRGATEVWFINEPILKWHDNRYPQNSQKFYVVSNGFDESFLDRLNTELHDTKSSLVFGYLGTIYGTMPLRQALEGWALAREQSIVIKNARLDIRGYLGHYSTPNAALLETIDEFSKHGVTYGGPVSKTAIADVYNGFNALLLALSSSPYISSGKVFEYAATGLPIISVHETDSAASAILHDHPHWFPASEMSAQAIANAFIAAAECAKTITASDISNARKWAAKFSRDRQLAPRIDALTKLIQ